MSPKIAHWLKEIALMAAIGGGVFLVFHYIGLEKQRGGGGALEVGVEAPAFDMVEARDGRTVTLADLQGKPVILAFWATYCGPCKRRSPGLERVHRAANGRYAVVTTSSERQSTVKRFLAEQPYSFPVLLDSAGRYHDLYNVDSVPTTVIIDARGRIVHDFTGTADADILAEHMAALLDAP